MNIPLGILALIFAIRLLPKFQPRTGPKMELDLVGIFFLGIAALSLMLPFVLTTGGPTDDPWRLRWAPG